MSDQPAYEIREKDLIESDISAYLKRHEEKDMLRFLTAGSVDDGKSTLIGRLLYDSKMIYEDQLATVMKDSKVHGTTGEDFDPALLTDGLKAEREQGITIDVAYRYFSTDKRSFIICDAPGHEQYTRNMATGASNCNLAIILIDARHGVMPQTRRHSFIASLLGIKHFVVAVNKMDAVDYSEDVFRKIRKDYEGFAARFDVPDIHFLPISALKGDNVVDRSENMPWYQGEPLLSYLENVEISSDRNLIDFRFPVQYVIRPDLNFRGFAGTVSSGIIRVGDEVAVHPSGARTTIKSIETFDGPIKEAFAGQAVVLTTTEEVDISRGSVLSRPNNVPEVGSNFDATLVWMNEKALQTGRNYLVRFLTQVTPATVEHIQYTFDINELHRKEPSSQEEARMELNDIGRVHLSMHRPVSFDPYTRNRKTGGFILIDPVSNATVAAGLVLARTSETHHRRKELSNPQSTNIGWETSGVSAEEREALFGHKPATIWLTGFSGSGKSTTGRALERLLVDKGIKAFVLDGDNIRHGLSRDLCFSEDDRTENIRRVSEVAKLLNAAGVVVISAFISPFKSDRVAAKSVVGENFVETYVDLPIEMCEERDAKGLYKKARDGEIQNFTGVSAAYEPPKNPDLHLKMEALTPEQAAEAIFDHLMERKLVPSNL